jgi:Mlc titration factor MtfA (ptsG expression regulator)
MSKPEQVDYAIASEWEATLWAGLRDKELTLNRKGLVEADSVNHSEEDFANNIEYFLFNPKTLKEKSPRVYDWISKKFGDKLKLRGVR